MNVHFWMKFIGKNESYTSLDFELSFDLFVAQKRMILVDIQVSFDKIAELSEADRAEVRDLFKAVYPPEEIEDWPGRHIEWAEFELCIRVWGDDGELASYVGIIVREANFNGQPVLVEGVGGVGTHPAVRRGGDTEGGRLLPWEFRQLRLAGLQARTD
jgi:hypothetical protein